MTTYTFRGETFDVVNGILNMINEGITSLEGMPELPDSLQRIYLQGNQFTSLKGLPERLPDSLQILYLQGNRLTSLEGMPELPDSLRILKLDRNQLTSLEGLPERLPESLQELYLNDNRLTTLKGLCPEGLPESLQELYLNNNELTSLEGLCPEGLPESLQILNLGDNQLISLVGLPERLPESLHSLYLRNNQLTSLEGLPDLPDSLEYLYLNYNQLTSLEGMPERLPDSLEMLYLYNNQLTSLEGLSDLPDSLQELRLYNNQLTSLEGMPELPESLKKLYLQGNRLTSLEGLPKIPESLRVLNLSNNQLTSLEGLPDIPNLKLLDLKGNRIDPNESINAIHPDAVVKGIAQEQVDRAKERWMESKNIVISYDHNNPASYRDLSDMIKELNTTPAKVMQCLKELSTSHGFLSLPELITYVRRQDIKCFKTNKCLSTSERFVSEHGCCISPIMTITLGWYHEEDIEIDMSTVRLVSGSEHTKYVKEGISEIDRRLLIAYTHNGDVVLNSYERAGGVTDALSEYIKGKYRAGEWGSLQYVFDSNTIDNSEMVEQQIIAFRDRIDSIINNAPPLEHDIIVYRGLNGEYYHFPDILFENNGIMSTTTSRRTAIIFGDNILRILVPKECKCLMISSISAYREEKEIILPSGTRYVICDNVECLEGTEPLYKIVC